MIMNKELKKLWNMRVMVIPIVFSALGMSTKGLEERLKELKIKGRIEIIHVTVLLRLVRILGRVLET